jgi:hypothetical protein
MIGKIRRVPLREVWKHEAHDFSSWLEDNLDVLSEELHLPLTLIKRERAAGRYYSDLLVRNDDRGNVIIENQLEDTDHRHLGQIITYMANIGSKTAIWVTKSPRPEHIRALEWLNEITPADTWFFLVQLEAHRIDGGNAAPYFKVVVSPSEETKKFGEVKRDLAEHQIQCREFWMQLLKRAKDQGFMLHANRTTTNDMWISGGAGKAGFSFNYVIWKDKDGAAELFIDTGDKRNNKRFFDQFKRKRRAIEKIFGGSLIWDRLDKKRAVRIRALVPGPGLKETSHWPEIQTKMIQAMRNLVRSLQPEIKGLK